MTGGMPYLVKPDEEVFVPEVNGQVLTNHQLANRANTARRVGSTAPIDVHNEIVIPGLGSKIKQTLRIELKKYTKPTSSMKNLDILVTGERSDAIGRSHP